MRRPDGTTNLLITVATHSSYKPSVDGNPDIEVANLNSSLQGPVCIPQIRVSFSTDN